ncbi:MAG: hypothetical protein ISN29_08240, partial [Gammaproteobacteria bacterium AqS3]|nr:hypothetical protein [Gammaproteobacteria bacterium AqS3]
LLAADALDWRHQDDPRPPVSLSAGTLVQAEAAAAGGRVLSLNQSLWGWVAQGGALSLRGGRIAVAGSLAPAAGAEAWSRRGVLHIEAVSSSSSGGALSIAAGAALAGVDEMRIIAAGNLRLGGEHGGAALSAPALQLRAGDTLRGSATLSASSAFLAGTARLDLGALTLSAGRAELHGGDILGGANALTLTRLGVSSGGSVDLAGAAHRIDTLALQAGTLRFSAAGGLTLGPVSAQTLDLRLASGDLHQLGALQAGLLSVRGGAGRAGSVALTHPANRIATLNARDFSGFSLVYDRAAAKTLSLRNVGRVAIRGSRMPRLGRQRDIGGAAGASGDEASAAAFQELLKIHEDDAGGLVLAADLTVGTLDITAPNGVTASHSLTANSVQLTVDSDAHVKFTAANNTILQLTLSGAAGLTLSVNSDTTLSVVSVTTVLLSGAANISLQTLQAGLSASIRAGGDITAPGAVSATFLTLRAESSAVLTHSANSLTSVILTASVATLFNDSSLLLVSASAATLSVRAAGSILQIGAFQIGDSLILEAFSVIESRDGDITERYDIIFGGDVANNTLGTVSGYGKTVTLSRRQGTLTLGSWDAELMHITAKDRLVGIGPITADRISISVGGFALLQHYSNRISHIPHLRVRDLFELSNAADLTLNAFQLSSVNILNSGALTLNALTVSHLTVTARGDIIQLGGAIVTSILRLHAFDVDTLLGRERTKLFNISFANANNSLRQVEFIGRTITVNNPDYSLVLGSISAETLFLRNGDTVTDTAAITVGLLSADLGLSGALDLTSGHYIDTLQANTATLLNISNEKNLTLHDISVITEVTTSYLYTDPDDGIARLITESFHYHAEIEAKGNITGIGKLQIGTLSATALPVPDLPLLPYDIRLGGVGNAFLRLAVRGKNVLVHNTLATFSLDSVTAVAGSVEISVQGILYIPAALGGDRANHVLGRNITLSASDRISIIGGLSAEREIMISSPNTLDIRAVTAQTIHLSGTRVWSDFNIGVLNISASLITVTHSDNVTLLNITADFVGAFHADGNLTALGEVSVREMEMDLSHAGGQGNLTMTNESNAIQTIDHFKGASMTLHNSRHLMAVDVTAEFLSLSISGTLRPNPHRFTATALDITVDGDFSMTQTAPLNPSVTVDTLWVSADGDVRLLLSRPLTLSQLLASGAVSVRLGNDSSLQIGLLQYQGGAAYISADSITAQTISSPNNGGLHIVAAENIEADLIRAGHHVSLTAGAVGGTLQVDTLRLENAAASARLSAVDDVSVQSLQGAANTVLLSAAQTVNISGDLGALWITATAATLADLNDTVTLFSVMVSEDLQLQGDGLIVATGGSISIGDTVSLLAESISFLHDTVTLAGPVYLSASQIFMSGTPTLTHLSVTMSAGLTLRNAGALTLSVLGDLAGGLDISAGDDLRFDVGNVSMGGALTLRAGTDDTDDLTLSGHLTGTGTATLAAGGSVLGNLLRLSNATDLRISAGDYVELEGFAGTHHLWAPTVSLSSRNDITLGSATVIEILHIRAGRDVIHDPRPKPLNVPAAHEENMRVKFVDLSAGRDASVLNMAHSQAPIQTVRAVARSLSLNAKELTLLRMTATDAHLLAEGLLRAESVTVSQLYLTAMSMIASTDPASPAEESLYDINLTQAGNAIGTLRARGHDIRINDNGDLTLSGVYASESLVLSVQHDILFISSSPDRNRRPVSASVMLISAGGDISLFEDSSGQKLRAATMTLSLGGTLLAAAGDRDRDVLEATLLSLRGHASVALPISASTLSLDAGVNRISLNHSGNRIETLLGTVNNLSLNVLGSLEIGRAASGGDAAAALSLINRSFTGSDGELTTTGAHVRITQDGVLTSFMGSGPDRTSRVFTVKAHIRAIHGISPARARHTLFLSADHLELNGQNVLRGVDTIALEGFSFSYVDDGGINYVVSARRVSMFFRAGVTIADGPLSVGFLHASAISIDVDNFRVIPTGDILLRDELNEIGTLQALGRTLEVSVFESRLNLAAILGEQSVVIHVRRNSIVQGGTGGISGSYVLLQAGDGDISLRGGGLHADTLSLSASGDAHLTALRALTLVGVSAGTVNLSISAAAVLISRASGFGVSARVMNLNFAGQLAGTLLRQSSPISLGLLSVSGAELDAGGATVQLSHANNTVLTAAVDLSARHSLTLGVQDSLTLSGMEAAGARLSVNVATLSLAGTARGSLTAFRPLGSTATVSLGVDNSGLEDDGTLLLSALGAGLIILNSGHLGSQDLHLLGGAQVSVLDGSSMTVSNLLSVSVGGGILLDGAAHDWGRAVLHAGGALTFHEGADGMTVEVLAGNAGSGIALRAGTLAGGNWVHGLDDAIVLSGVAAGVASLTLTAGALRLSGDILAPVTGFLIQSAGGSAVVDARLGTVNTPGLLDIRGPLWVEGLRVRGPSLTLSADSIQDVARMGQVSVAGPASIATRLNGSVRLINSGNVLGPLYVLAGEGNVTLRGLNLTVGELLADSVWLTAATLIRGYRTSIGTTQSTRIVVEPDPDNPGETRRREEIVNIVLSSAQSIEPALVVNAPTVSFDGISGTLSIGGEALRTLLLLGPGGFRPQAAGFETVTDAGFRLLTLSAGQATISAYRDVSGSDPVHLDGLLRIDTNGDVSLVGENNRLRSISLEAATVVLANDSNMTLLSAWVSRLTLDLGGGADRTLRQANAVSVSGELRVMGRGSAVLWGADNDFGEVDLETLAVASIRAADSMHVSLYSVGAAALQVGSVEIQDVGPPEVRVTHLADLTVRGSGLDTVSVHGALVRNLTILHGGTLSLQGGEAGVLSLSVQSGATLSAGAGVSLKNGGSVVLAGAGTALFGHSARPAQIGGSIGALSLDRVLGADWISLAGVGAAVRNGGVLLQSLTVSGGLSVRMSGAGQGVLYLNRVSAASTPQLTAAELRGQSITLSSAALLNGSEQLWLASLTALAAGTLSLTGSSVFASAVQLRALGLLRVSAAARASLLAVSRANIQLSASAARIEGATVNLLSAHVPGNLTLSAELATVSAVDGLDTGSISVGGTLMLSGDSVALADQRVKASLLHVLRQVDPMSVSLWASADLLASLAGVQGGVDVLNLTADGDLTLKAAAQAAVSGSLEALAGDDISLVGALTISAGHLSASGTLGAASDLTLSATAGLLRLEAGATIPLDVERLYLRRIAVSAPNAAVRNQAGAITLEGVSVGTLNLSLSGDIIGTSAVTARLLSLRPYSAGAGGVARRVWDIDLTHTANRIATIALTGATVQMLNAAALAIDGVSANSLSIRASGSIVQALNAGALGITGTANFEAWSISLSFGVEVTVYQDISLAASGNTLGSIGGAGANVYLHNGDTLTLAGWRATSMTVSAWGDIHGRGPITASLFAGLVQWSVGDGAGGLVTHSGDVYLTHPDNRIGSLNIPDAGTVGLFNTGAVTLSAMNVANLSVRAEGSILQAGALTVQN